MMGLDMYITQVEGNFEDILTKYDYDKILNTDSITCIKDVEKINKFLNANRKEVAYWRKDYELNSKILSTIHNYNFDSDGCELIITKENLNKLITETSSDKLRKLLDTTDFKNHTLVYLESH